MDDPDDKFRLVFLPLLIRIFNAEGQRQDRVKIPDAEKELGSRIIPGHGYTGRSGSPECSVLIILRHFIIKAVSQIIL